MRCDDQRKYAKNPFMSFNPSGVGVKNGNFFSLPYAWEESEVVILSAPWDVTTSYRPGTASGPEVVLEASSQVDLTTPYAERPWERKIGTLPISQAWFEASRKLRATAEKVISGLEEGRAEKDFERELNLINTEGARFHADVRKSVAEMLERGKKVVLLGGDHSTSWGAIQAHADRYPGLSVLHYDAHADLRVAYEGFAHSHASIMNHVKDMPGVAKLVQVGIRDYSPDEKEESERNPKIRTFFDTELKHARYRGKTWDRLCDEIVGELGPNVYVSFDIDGLDPRYCPNTGTPVPGGLEFDESVYLLWKVVQSGRKLVGADLVEVSVGEGTPGEDTTDWDANVGARLLWQMCALLS